MRRVARESPAPKALPWGIAKILQAKTAFGRSPLAQLDPSIANGFSQEDWQIHSY